MSRLYVANPTNQNHKFLYKLPEVQGYREQLIRLWAQENIAGELNTLAINDIIDHHRNYGMIREGEQAPTDKIVSLVYSIDKPVKLETIRLMMAHNELIMKKRGQEAREAAAIQVSQQMEQMMFERQLPDRLQQLEMSIQEDVQDPHLAEGIRVTHDLPANGAAQAPARSRRRRGN